MELDEMKQLWQKMDETISKQQAISENIIKRMLHEKNANSLKSIVNLEYLGILLASLVIALLLTQAPRISGNGIALVVCYIAGLLSLAASAVFGLYKIQYLSALDAGTEPVSNMAEKTERFRLMIAKERIVSLVLGPVVMVVFYVVIFYLLKNINVLDNITSYLHILIAAVAVYIVSVLALYKKLYFNQIDTINNNLREIAEFKR